MGASKFNEKQIPRPPLFKTKHFSLVKVLVRSTGRGALIRKDQFDAEVYEWPAGHTRAVADELKAKAAKVVAEAKEAEAVAKAEEKVAKAAEADARKHADAEAKKAAAAGGDGEGGSTG